MNRVGNLYIVLAILVLGGTLWNGINSEAGNLLAFMVIVYYGENILSKLEEK